MERFRSLYALFYERSKFYLESGTGTAVGDTDLDADLDTFLTVIPLLERKVCAISADMPAEKVVQMMKYFNYKLLSFWFLRSDAVAKSIYKRIADESERARFLDLFRDTLVSAKVIVSLNAVYRNIKRDTDEIIQDSKRIMEIFAHMRKTSGDQQAYRLLVDNHAFIVRTLNKVLSDENYILKIISLFNTELVTDRDKLEEYREVFTFSTDGAVHGIRCFGRITIDGVEPVHSKYVDIFRRMLNNVLLFQNHALNSKQFVSVVGKLYRLMYEELTGNEEVGRFLSAVMEAMKARISVEELKRRNVGNLQNLISEISRNRDTYRELIAEEYAKHRSWLTCILQEIVDRRGVRYDGAPVNIGFVFDHVHEAYVSKVMTNSKSEPVNAVHDKK
ncbi:virion morphogenesis core protein [Eastern grey kangaroopox virus]|uniref:Virion morphogenesis core protein n=1 Tax=Eastern grey kangaroopox virus TaxID=2042482 RepID=A0A2C9DT73_9POXV|nr:virion morphogenesis core protein [Eastern grey kangaroopox virus]ATI21206.1 virion morphogenesis core protein [Eastern grey kangaroopox virus]ATX75113.1 virion morphogenesis core protein [Eastern grey kangaroopox virus]